MKGVTVSVVLTVHREGLLLGATLRSVDRAVEAALKAGFSIELVVSLDRPDPITREVIASWIDRAAICLENDIGDLGLCRNRCIERASGEFVAIADGDDLWSRSWLVEAGTAALVDRRKIVWHPEVSVFFGEENFLFCHVDMEDERFDRLSLVAINPWTSLCFASRELFLQVPYPETDLALGIGYEDWRWNRRVLEFGALHKIVVGTCHLIRRKGSSLLTHSAAAKALPILKNKLLLQP